jgi:hypothetical protein
MIPINEHLMRALCAVCCVCWPIGAAAQGAAYLLQFIGKKLQQVPLYQPIQGADRLIMQFTGATAPAANACTDVTANGWGLVSFSDGIHSLASLEQEGWQLSTANLSVCTDATGKNILSWSGQFTLLYQYPSDDYYVYAALFEAPAAQGVNYPGPLFYGVQMQHWVDFGLHGVMEDWNPTSPGAWKLKGAGEWGPLNIRYKSPMRLVVASRAS